LVKLIDLKTVEPYFTDPAQAPATASAPDPTLVAVQAQLALEKAQAEAAIALEDRKIAGEIAVAERKFELDKQKLILDAELKARDKQQAALGAALAQEAGGDDTQPDTAAASGNAVAALVTELAVALKQLSAPKRVVRDAQGRVSHVEPMGAPKPLDGEIAFVWRMA